jgi:hypothetical protein
MMLTVTSPSKRTRLPRSGPTGYSLHVSYPNLRLEALFSNIIVRTFQPIYMRLTGLLFKASKRMWKRHSCPLSVESPRRLAGQLETLFSVHQPVFKSNIQSHGLVSMI